MKRSLPILFFLLTSGMLSRAQTTSFTGVVFNDFQKPLKSRNIATEPLVDNGALFQGGLNVNLIDTVANTVLATAVLGNGGSYTLTLAGTITNFSTYVIELSENAGTVGNPPPPPANIGPLWVNTGEGDASDLFANGKVNPVTGLVNDFGIQRLPTTTPFTISTIAPTLNPPVAWNLDANPLAGDDPSEDGVLGTGASFEITASLVFTSGPSGGNPVPPAIAELVYLTAPNVFTVLNVGSIIQQYDPTKFFIRYNGIPTGQVKFEYRAIDGADGKATNVGLYFIDQPLILPARELTLWAETNGANSRTLHWKTNSEINTSHFEVQEAGANGIFKTIGTVKAAGNSHVQANYSFPLDNKSSMPFFRIKLLDRDGSFQLSNTIHLPAVVLGKARLYPNPTTNGQVQVKLQQPGQHQIRLVDYLGRTIKVQQASISGETIVLFTIPEGVHGWYKILVQHTDSQTRWQETLLVQ